MGASKKVGIIAWLGKNELASRLILGTIGALLFIGFWQFLLEPIARAIYGNPGLEFPTFSESLGSLLSSFTHRDLWNPNFMGDHLASSLARVMLGFGLAAVIAVPVGLMMGWARKFEHFAFPVNELARPIPPLAWIPVALILMEGELKVVFICFLGAYFPILISTIQGVKSIDPLLFDASKTLGAGRADVFLKVVVPATTGHIMTGLRVGLGVAWMTIVAAEMIGANNGIGWYIYATAIQIGDYTQSLGGMILIGVIGYIIFIGIEVGERRILKWMGMR